MKNGFNKCLWAARLLRRQAKQLGLPPPSRAQQRLARQSQPDYGKALHYGQSPKPAKFTNSEQVYFCYICDGPGTTRHHLIPKVWLERRPYDPQYDSIRHSVIRCCRSCHDAIHRHFTINELAERFFTPEKLKREFLIRTGRAEREDKWEKYGGQHTGSASA